MLQVGLITRVSSGPVDGGLVREMKQNHTFQQLTLWTVVADQNLEPMDSPIRNVGRDLAMITKASPGLNFLFRGGSFKRTSPEIK